MPGPGAAGAGAGASILRAPPHGRRRQAGRTHAAISMEPADCGAGRGGPGGGYGRRARLTSDRRRPGGRAGSEAGSRAAQHHAGQLRRPGIPGPRHLGRGAEVAVAVRRAAGVLCPPLHDHPDHSYAGWRNRAAPTACQRGAVERRAASLPDADRAELGRKGRRLPDDPVLPRHLRPRAGEPQRAGHDAVPIAVRHQPVHEGNGVGGADWLGDRPGRVQLPRAPGQARAGHLPRDRRDPPGVPADVRHLSPRRYRDRDGQGRQGPAVLPGPWVLCTGRDPRASRRGATPG